MKGSPSNKPITLPSLPSISSFPLPLQIQQQSQQQQAPAQQYALQLANQNFPVPSRPNSGKNRLFATYEMADKIKEEFAMVEAKIESLQREKVELHLQYSKHWEIAHQLNAEVNKQTEMNNRYQGIINQLIPMLKPDVQSGVLQDIDSIKTIAEAPIAPPPQAPYIMLDQNEYVHVQNGEDKRPRGRPSKARLEKIKEDHSAASSAASLLPSKRPRTLDDGPDLPIHSTAYRTEQHTAPATIPRLNPSAAISSAATNGTTAPLNIDTSVPRGVNLVTVLPHGEVVCALALSNPFKHVYTGGKGVVKIWDVSNMSTTRKSVNVGRLECLDNYIRACHITRDSKTLIVGGEARHMVVCDIGSGNPVISGKLQTPNQLTYALCASKDSRTVFSCCSDGSVNMWDLRSLSLVKTFEGHEDSVTCCCLTPDGQKLITGSLDKTVRVWDIAEGRQHISYPFASQVFSLGVCPLEPIIAVGLENSVVDVRYLSNFDLNQELRLHDSCVLGLKYSPNGSWFVTSGKDLKWAAWKSLNCETLFQQPENASILSCDISRDGKYIVTGSGENNANIYEVLY